MSRRFLLVLALFLAPLPLAAAGLKAVAVTVNAPARFSHDGVKYSKLKAGSALFGGDVIRTGENGRVVVRFVDGSQAAIASNTDVALRRLTPQEDPVKTTLSLLRGSLRAFIKKLGARSSFEVETYNTVVAVKGTYFEVGVAVDKDGHKKTVASCFETQGKGLEVSGLDGKDPVTVGAGQQTLNSTGRPELPSVLGAKDLQKALEKYRTLSLQSKATAKAADAAAGTGTEGTPAVTPAPAASAAEKAAEDAFNASARKAETALGAYLDAVDSGDKNAQGDLEKQLGGLRENAATMEEQLTDSERLLEEKIQQQIQQEKENPGSTKSGDQELLQAQLQEIKQLQETLKEVALQTHLETQADSAQGNLLMDRDGIRTQVNSSVNRASTLVQDDTIQMITLSQRNEGANRGRTEFQHVIVFNQALPSSWVGIYQRPLNDPLNLAGGAPEFWRVEDAQKTFSPAGDCVCLETDLGSPVLDVPAALYRQNLIESFQAIGAGGGIAQGQRSYDALLGVWSGDDIQITATDTGSSLLLSYDNLGGPTGYIGNIFTVDLSLPSLPNGAALQNAASFGSSLLAVANANLSGVDGNMAFQLTFTSPAYPGHQVVPLLDKASFVDAFSEIGR